MKIYDKASWHIDNGEQATIVIARFRELFVFLKEKMMLTVDGIETLEYAMDSSVSLNSTMVNSEGKNFLDRYYDEIIASNASEIKKNLVAAYGKYRAE